MEIKRVNFQCSMQTCCSTCDMPDGYVTRVCVAIEQLHCVLKVEMILIVKCRWSSRFESELVINLHALCIVSCEVLFDCKWWPSQHKNVTVERTFNKERACKGRNQQTYNCAAPRSRPRSVTYIILSSVSIISASKTTQENESQISGRPLFDHHANETHGEPLS